MNNLFKENSVHRIEFWKSLVMNQEFWKVFITGLGYSSLSIFYISYSGPPFKGQTYLAPFFVLLLFPFPIATTLGVFISSRRFKFILFFLILLASFVGSIVGVFMSFLVLPITLGIIAFLLIRNFSIADHWKIIISVMLGIISSLIIVVYVSFLETTVIFLEPTVLAKLYQFFLPLVNVNFFFLALAGFSIGAGLLFSIIKSPKLNKWALLFGAITAVLFVVLVTKYKLIIGEMPGLFFLFGMWLEIWASLLGTIIALSYNTNSMSELQKEAQ